MTKATNEADVKQSALDIYPDMKVDRYWDWRIEHKDVKVKARRDNKKATITFTYPECGHTKTYSVAEREAVRMAVADYHYPDCLECRQVKFAAANKEKEKKQKGLVSLGLAIETAK